MSTAKEIADGTLYSATETAQSAKEFVKQSNPIQRYIVGPAVFAKKCLVTGSTIVSCSVKSEMSPLRLFLSVATVLAVLGFLTFSELSFTVSKDNVMMTKFKVHPPSLRLALLTGASVGLVSILVALFVPPAFTYVRVHVTGSRMTDKKRKESSTTSAPVSDGRTSSSTSGPFEAYRKQAGKTDTSGGGRHPRHGSDATVDAVAETLATSKRHSEKEY